ncbi:MAG TPA: endonuclease V [candidate division Zixibacteria bacterium]|jgi:deoxyribonuclease V
MKTAFIPPQILRHPWNVSVSRAAAIQSALAKYLSLTPHAAPPRIVAGVDAAEDGDNVYVAIVVMDIIKGKIIEIQCAHTREPVAFPKLGGYSAFRLGPTALAAWKRIYHTPDLALFASHGVCHPRRCGLATHLGMRMDVPSIGCARERLVGRYDPPGPKRGDYAVVRYSPQAPAVVLRTRSGVNSLFVSPGHRIDLLGSIDTVLRCCTTHRLPEPLRRAHIEAGRYMRMRKSGVTAPADTAE